MSALQLPEPTRRRLPTIKAMLLEGKTAVEIGNACGVTAKTIERDKRYWRQSGDLEDWIREEAIRLHYIVVKKKPIEAYREIMRLLGKTMIQRVEKTVDVTEKVGIIVKMYRPDENESAT